MNAENRSVANLLVNVDDREDNDLVVINSHLAVGGGRRVAGW